MSRFLLLFEYISECLSRDSPSLNSFLKKYGLYGSAFTRLDYPNFELRVQVIRWNMRIPQQTSLPGVVIRTDAYFDR
jgi:hypothetical protein